MTTILGWHPSSVAGALAVFVVLQAVRILVTRAVHRRRMTNVVDLAERRPDPTVDEHVAFPEDAVLLDLATARARRG